MSVTVGDVVRCVAEWDMPDGTIAQIVYHLRGKTGGIATDATMLAAARDALQAAWLNIDQEVSTAVLGSLLECFVWDFALNQFDGIGSIPFGALDGTNVGEMLPHGAAALVKMFTVSARRQARKYVPGLVETTQDEGTIGGASLTQLALFAADIDDDVTAGALILEFGTLRQKPLRNHLRTILRGSVAVIAEIFLSCRQHRFTGKPMPDMTRSATLRKKEAPYMRTNDSRDKHQCYQEWYVQLCIHSISTQKV